MQSIIIDEDIELLHLMMNSQQRHGGSYYSPGPYWKIKTDVTMREINKNGIANFRSYENSAATSCSDTVMIDIRNEFSGFRYTLVNFLTRLFPINKIFNAQVEYTKGHTEHAKTLESMILNQSNIVSYLTKKYTIPGVTNLGGAVRYTKVGNQEVSHHYLELLHRLDLILRNFDITKKRSYFEIGGGFGANLHLLISNFDNLRKFIYLDIAPNLYFGTQYLKSFYGKHVVDCVRNTKDTKLAFSNNNDLEILCILPHQIENLDCQIDIFHNANSFVEMPQRVVENYAKWIKKIMNPEGGIITFNSYADFDIEATFHPDKIPEMFSMDFNKKTNDGLIGNPELSYFASINSQFHANL